MRDRAEELRALIRNADLMARRAEEAGNRGWQAYWTGKARDGQRQLNAIERDRALRIPPRVVCVNGVRV